MDPADCILEPVSNANPTAGGVEDLFESERPLSTEQKLGGAKS